MTPAVMCICGGILIDLCYHLVSICKRIATVCVSALTFLGGAWNMVIAVEAGIDPQLALSHTVLLQVPIKGEGPRPVQPNNCQITAH